MQCQQGVPVSEVPLDCCHQLTLARMRLFRVTGVDDEKLDVSRTKGFHGVVDTVNDHNIATTFFENLRDTSAGRCERMPGISEVPATGEDEDAWHR